jgi:hypothetical protein
MSSPWVGRQANHRDLINFACTDEAGRGGCAMSTEPASLRRSLETR